jgi:hypothetical protein
MRAPDIPREAPAIMLKIVLGIRSRTTKAAKDVSLLSSRELTTLLNSMLFDPHANDASTHKAKNIKLTRYIPTIFVNFI